jgi:hypothetical protein
MKISKKIKNCLSEYINLLGECCNPIFSYPPKSNTKK